MDKDNEHSDASSGQTCPIECDQLSNEECQLVINRSSCISSREVKNENKNADEKCEINYSPNQCGLNENVCESEPAVSPELAEQEVAKSNITGDDPKTEDTQQLENSVQMVSDRKSEALYRLTAYGGETDSDDSNEDISSKEVSKPTSDNNKTKTEQAWRNNEEDQSDSCDSDSDSTNSTLSSDSESDSDSDDSDQKLNNSSEENATSSRNENKTVPSVGDKGAVKKTSKQIGIEENFPPIPDLSKIVINEKEEFLHLGQLQAIVGTLVTIESIPNIPAFDLDSMLFIGDSQKKPLGPIFDVLGPVSQPIYCVRFNTEDEIKAGGIVRGMKVYAAPQSDEFSKFVFIKELLKMKGSDASAAYDRELPAELWELSDDEHEFQANRVAKSGQKRKTLNTSAERHRKYEKTMNQCNTFNTKVCNLVDARKKSVRPRRPTATVTSQSQTFPEFNPAVPPPGFGQHFSFGYIGQPQLEVPARFPNLQANYAPVFNEQPQFGNFGPSVTSPYFVPQPLTWQNYQNNSGPQFNQGPDNLQSQYNCYTNSSRNSNSPNPGPSSQP